MKAKKKFSYYDFSPILSRNATINMVMGARGLGKTYGAKKIAIRNAIRRGEQFIYLRRYRTELKGRESFFSDIAHEFPDFEFRISGGVAEMKHVDDGKEKWEIIGYFIALSTSQSNKSVAYPKVTTILFDEFIIEKGNVQYLPNEVKRLYDFYSTVDRWQDKTRIFMLSNSVSIMNPYFIEYDLSPTREFALRGDGFVCAHFVDSERFASEVAKTRFGSFIVKHSSDYADYSISNVFADNDDEFIMKKNGTAKYNFTLRTKQGTFSVWIDGATWFIQQRRPKSQERLYTLVGSNMKEGECLLVYGDKIMQLARSAYKHGRMFFDNPTSRNAFREVFVR